MIRFLLNLRRRKLPMFRDLSKEDWEHFKAIYGTYGWKVFEKMLENRRFAHNQDILAEWYKAGADDASMKIAATRTACLVSMIRENEALMEDVAGIMAEPKQAVIAQEPKTIAQYLP